MSIIPPLKRTRQEVSSLKPAWAAERVLGQSRLIVRPVSKQHLPPTQTPSPQKRSNMERVRPIVKKSTATCILDYLRGLNVILNVTRRGRWWG
jgi:hypothetical protein